MSFSKLIRQQNILLIPFSWLYKAGALVYHKLYDFGVMRSYHPHLPTICVGNLSVGGTGKSPMVEYLLRLLKSKWPTAVVSRGYRRKTKGFVLAGEETTVTDIGDEPMQFYRKFPDIAIAVGERRLEAIELLLHQRPETRVIILDDAYQHRPIAASLNLLLTECDHLFTKDKYLPFGRLRDLKSNYKRADIIVVTKCRNDLSVNEKEKITRSLKLLPDQKIFFTAIDYEKPYHIFTGRTIDLTTENELILVTGIANPAPVLDYLKRQRMIVHPFLFPDHHHFSEKDILNIVSSYKNRVNDKTIILTTEKDAMRLRNWNILQSLPVFALPVAHRFLFGEGDAFDQYIEQSIQTWNCKRSKNE